MYLLITYLIGAGIAVGYGVETDRWGDSLFVFLTSPISVPFLIGVKITVP